MPQVPRYGANQVREDITRQRVDISAPAEVFGGGRALAGFEAVRQTADVFQKVADNVNQTEALNAVNQMKQAKIKMMYDPKEGALAQQGAAAFDAIGIYGKQFEEMGASLEKNLKNDQQREYFRRYYNQEALSLEADLSRHVFQEAEKYDNQETEALIQNYRNDAILNYSDPNKIRQALLGQEVELMRHAERTGKPAAWVKQKLDDLNSKTHAGIVGAYISNDQDQEAELYFKANKDGFTAIDLENVQKDLEQATLRGKAQRMTDSIYKTSGGNERAAFAEARKIEDPKVRDEVEQRISQRFAQEKRLKDAEIEQLHIKALNQIDATGELAIEKIPGWQKMSVSDRTSLKAYAAAKGRNEEIKTQWAEYYDLMTQASSDATREQFLRTNLMTYRNKLADAEFKQLVGMQKDLREGKPGADKLLDGYRSDTMIVDDALRAAGFKTGSDAKQTDKEKVAQFRRMVDQEIIKLQERTGKKANNNDIQSIVDTLLIERTKPGAIFGSFWPERKREFEVTPEEADQYRVEVPDDYVAKAKEAARRKGIPISERDITELYLRKIGRGNIGGR